MSSSSSYLINNRFPPIPATQSKSLTATEITTAIDFVNRHNFIFTEFTHETMLSTFLPDATVYHTHGTLHGHTEFKSFFENIYGFFIPGIARSATNHVVDRDEDGGVTVRYLETLVRYGYGKEEEDGVDDPYVVTGKDAVRGDGLPAVWWVGTMVDRLRMTEDGWRIYERYLGAPVRNGGLDLPKKA
ncbi:hypothetical protein BJX70DRAFT_367741 [Aspergillus crustosus]